ncbi:toll/interleukin-1 receptor domain-containing protein [Escherichia coli]|nr:toll/interleukin-1 receptor domain-containing protein [Escherichia coli]MCZ5744377.1 toll/interleukin-1 receptor domain-containing protein [Escherichia coli]
MGKLHSFSPALERCKVQIWHLLPKMKKKGLQMIKCFLSHSSKDKDYVRVVASGLRKETRIFDEQTFEKGMSPSEEILKGLDDTSLFVLFLSDSALESDWVKEEMRLAKKKSRGWSSATYLSNYNR